MNPSLTALLTTYFLDSPFWTVNPNGTLTDERRRLRDAAGVPSIGLAEAAARELNYEQEL